MGKKIIDTKRQAVSLARELSMMVPVAVGVIKLFERVFILSCFSDTNEVRFDY